MNRFKGISQKFPAEAAAVGRLLAGYADLEMSLLHCVQMARGGDLDAVLKAMFGTRGETRRIDTPADSVNRHMIASVWDRSLRRQSTTCGSFSTFGTAMHTAYGTTRMLAIWP